MRGQEPHRLAGGRAHGGEAQPLDETFQDRIRALAGMDDARGDAERPSRRGNEQRIRFDVVGGPIAGRKLVLDQPIGGGGIGHPQQRLRQHHEGKPLLGGQRIGMEEVLDPAEPAGFGPDARDEAGRMRVNSPLGVGRAGRLSEQRGRQRLVGRRVGRREDDSCAGIRGAGDFRIWNHDRSQARLVPARACGVNLNSGSCRRSPE